MNNKVIVIGVLTALLMGCDGDDGRDGTDGQSGNDGLNALISTTALPAGHQQCALGGQLIETGLDANRNDTLEDDEVNADATQVICNGASPELNAQLIGRYQSGEYGTSAAEIVAYHPASRRIFVVNAASGQLDILNAEVLANAAVADDNGIDLDNINKLDSLDVAADIDLPNLGGVNSVAISGNLLAAAIERGDGTNSKQSNGYAAFYTLSDAGEATYLKAVEVGALPDNLAFTPDGSKLLVANEGEPNNAYTLDPEGSVSVIAITDGIPVDTALNIGFTYFNLDGSRADEVSELIKINGPGSSVAQDLEPEYIAVSRDSKTAWVSLQENNAVAKLDLTDSSVVALQPLGFKDFSLPDNALDASDKDDAISFQSWEQVVGMYQPDTLVSFSYKGADFYITANEGDARDYAGFSEEVRADDLTLDPNHPQLAAAQDKTQLGRLKVTTSMGDTDGDGDYDTIVSYGGRSFSIRDANGNLVYDSGSDFERITAALLGSDFNNHNEQNKGDSRSDDKGPEPEALAVGTIGGKTFAFIGLERTSGFMIYDISNPFAVRYVDYVVNRDFSVDFEIDGDTITGQPGLAGDLGPEGMKFVDAVDSPNGKPLLIISNEVSGTTSVYQLVLE
ncbi:choice-of-anchor I family protein [Shewanella submarina]|uniref:Choice-of-anchor I family protein n=1 Tax=Shewanella submarina TaxID=2016376 RepID=A0ABV7GDI8_9GAMM|nr:choice-of-anchor I family protein [Shewanella submarina]MCL1037609.1 choice-of-anchor I family protein [Shewanella submarina]